MHLILAAIRIQSSLCSESAREIALASLRQRPGEDSNMHGIAKDIEGFCGKFKQELCQHRIALTDN